MTQNNKLPKIKIATVAGKKTYIPLKHTVNATQRIGKITPYMMRFMDANSKVKINLETLEYNSPMVSPTVGDIYLKHWIYFVGLDKLSHDFVEMFTKQNNVDNLGREFVHTKVPRMRLSELTMLCMTGAFCTIYSGFDPNTFMLPDSGSSEYNRIVNTFNTYVHKRGNEVNSVRFEKGGNNSFITRDAVIFENRETQILGMGATCLNTSCLRPDGDFLQHFGYGGMYDDIVIPLSNPNRHSFYNWVQASPDGNGFVPVWNNQGHAYY